MRSAQATTASQARKRGLGLAKLVDGLVDERHQFLAELGVDEALDLLALRGVTLPARLCGELGAREHVEKLEHGGLAAGIARRQDAVERQPEREIRQAG